VSLPQTERYVWDYRTGDVIDVMTGEVIDRIYVSYMFRSITDDEIKRTRSHKSFYYMLRPETRAFLRNSNSIKYVTQQSESKSKDILENVPYNIRVIIDLVIDKYPVLKSRTARCRAAIAYILYFLAKYNSVSAAHKRRIARECDVARSYVDSLIRQVKKLPYANSLIREVRSLID